MSGGVEGAAAPSDWAEPARPWRVAVYGVGAIGGFIGTRLAASGCQVSAVARGATLAALREHGLRLRQDGELI